MARFFIAAFPRRLSALRAVSDVSQRGNQQFSRLTNTKFLFILDQKNSTSKSIDIYNEKRKLMSVVTSSWAKY